MKPATAFVILVSLFAWGCGDDDSSPTGSETVNYTYEQFVRFDTTEYRFARQDYPRHGVAIPEPIVNWEQSLGEPFTDLNGNGIYEPGIDSFVISPDTNVNQDLNHNDQYDGPDDPWSPGIPFDDIDGDGEFREDPGQHITGYILGMPYADLNGNARRDGDLQAVYGVFAWRSAPWYGDHLALSFARCTTAVYRFLSDSGLTYDLPFGFDPIMSPLILTDTSLEYRITPFTVPLLTPGQIEPQEDTILELPWYPDPVFYHRATALGASLNVDGRVFSGLVRVMLTHEDNRWVFYFSRQIGLLAYEFWQDLSTPPEEWAQYERTTVYYFRRLDASHSLVFPATR